MIRILLNGQPVHIFLFLPHISLILRTVLFRPFKIEGVVIQVILILMQYPRPAHQRVITGYKFRFRHKSINTRTSLVNRTITVLTIIAYVRIHRNQPIRIAVTDYRDYKQFFLLSSMVPSDRTTSPLSSFLSLSIGEYFGTCFHVRFKA